MEALPARLFRRRAAPVWITPTLALGVVGSLDAPRHLARLGIRAVLDVQAEGDGRGERLRSHEMAYLKLGVKDFEAPSEHELDAGTAWILERMRGDGPVLICCRLGLGRSALFAVATLLQIGYALPEAYRLVRERRAAIALSEAQIATLRTFAARAKRTDGS